MLGILAQRSHEEAAQSMTSPKSTRGKLTAGQLTSLFDQRKEAKSDREVKDLAELYGLSYEVLEGLAKYVTSPSVGSKVKTNTDGEMLMKVGCLFLISVFFFAPLSLLRCLYLQTSDLPFC